MGDIIETRMMINRSILRGVPFAIAHVFILPHVLVCPYSEAVVGVYLAGVFLYIYAMVLVQTLVGI